MSMKAAVKPKVLAFGSNIGTERESCGQHVGMIPVILTSCTMCNPVALLTANII